MAKKTPPELFEDQDFIQKLDLALGEWGTIGLAEFSLGQENGTISAQTHLSHIDYAREALLRAKSHLAIAKLIKHRARARKDWRATYELTADKLRMMFTVLERMSDAIEAERREGQAGTFMILDVSRVLKLAPRTAHTRVMQWVNAGLVDFAERVHGGGGKSHRFKVTAKGMDVLPEPVKALTSGMLDALAGSKSKTGDSPKRRNEECSESRDQT